MSKRHSNEYGQSWSLAAALLDKPKTIDELKKYYSLMTRRFGVYTELLPGKLRFHGKESIEAFLQTNLQQLVKRAWVVGEAGLYDLTDTGRAEAQKMLGEVEKGGDFLRKVTHPERVSRVTFVIHSILALVKIPAALFSGSIGLLNDGLDTLLDSLSSLFVHWGIRRNRERFVSILLLVFMTLTGGYSLFEAVRGIVFPSIPEPDFLAFGAMVLSAVLCGFLWVYQKFSGMKHQSLPLLTQALDSRNHVIVAGGVSAGLIASLLKIPYLDAIVGLVVSILILKGAFELMFELIRSAGDEELDLSRYGFVGYDRFQRKQLKTWLLYRIEQGAIHTAEELSEEAHSSLDFSKIALFRALGISDGGASEKNIGESLEAIQQEGLVEGEPLLSLSAEGERQLQLNMGRSPVFAKGFAYLGNFIYLAFRAVLFFGIFYLLHLLQERFIPHAVQGLEETEILLNIGGLEFNLPRIILVGAGLLSFLIGGRLRMLAGHFLHESRFDPNQPDSSSLVRVGPYRWMRHPMYAGMLLSGCGIGFSLFSLWGGILALIFLLGMILNAWFEDRKLGRLIPEMYSKYRTESPRLILHPLPFALLIGIFVFYGYYLLQGSLGMGF